MMADGCPRQSGGLFQVSEGVEISSKIDDISKLRKIWPSTAQNRKGVKGRRVTSCSHNYEYLPKRNSGTDNAAFTTFTPGTLLRLRFIFPRGTLII